MRLTIINQFYVPDISPTAHLAASLAEHRAKQGDDVTVVTSWGGYVPASTAEKKSERTGNPKVYRIWTPRLGKGNVIKRCIDYATFYLGAAWRMLRLPRQDVIVSLTTPPYIAWTAVFHKWLHPSAKIVLWNMDCYPELAERSDKLKENGFAARIMRWMNRAVFKRLDHLVCLDTAMVELLMSQYAPRNRELSVTTIPNWEKGSFFPRDRQPERWGDAGQFDGRFVVLYLGNMGYGHTFDTVIDAARTLRDEPVTFLFIGGGLRYATVETAIEQHNLDNVVLRGYVPKEQTPSVMAAADCALITLRDRILGVMSPSKLHSNLAMSLPVVYVGPPKSNVDDAIQRFECGISLRHGESDKLADYIRQLMNDEAAHQELRLRARNAFDAAYCDDVTLPQFDEIIDSLDADRPVSEDDREKTLASPDTVSTRSSRDDAAA